MTIAKRSSVRSSTVENPHVEAEAIVAASASSPSNRRRKWRETDFKIIPPHGTGGTSATASCHLPPKYKRIIELLYCHPDTPWKTESDVMRAFIDYASHHFAGAINSKVAHGLLHELDMMNEVIQRAREQSDFAATIDFVGREVDRLLSGGMRQSAVGLVYRYREQAAALSDRVLSAKLVAEVNLRWRSLLGGRQGRKDGEDEGLQLGSATVEGAEDQGDDGGDDEQFRAED